MTEPTAKYYARADELILMESVATYGDRYRIALARQLALADAEAERVRKVAGALAPLIENIEFWDSREAAKQLLKSLRTPDPEVDFLLIEAREIVAAHEEAEGFPTFANDVRKGEQDNHPRIGIALAALKRGVELAKESQP